MLYDLTLKELFHGAPSRLVQILTGRRAVETLNVEFPAVRKRQPDLVMRLDDGRIYHLELQSGGDAAMPWRMLEYYALIYQHYRAPVLQQVLYVGAGPNPLAESIAQDSLQYRYHVVTVQSPPAGWKPLPLLPGRWRNPRRRPSEGKAQACLYAVAG